MTEAALTRVHNARARLSEVGEGADRVKELVLDLGTFSRLDECDFKTVDVVEAIGAVLLLLKHKINRDICLEKHYAPERMLYCCIGRLRKVLMHLIRNSLDAIEGQGNILITTSTTFEDSLISVRDTGAESQKTFAINYSIRFLPPSWWAEAPA